jgi:flagellar biogenesis protein FliO
MNVPASTFTTLFFFVGAPILIWWLRRSRFSIPTGLRVASKTALTRNGVVAVIETDGRRFLIGATDNGINLLTELARNEDEAETDTEEEPAGALTLLPGTGPGTSPIEALRNMTVRKPTRPRMPRAHHRT